MSRILVTGGAGYIGSTTVALLLQRGYEVSVLDDCSMGHADAVPAQAQFFEGSILDGAIVRKALAGCDAVIHFAAKSLVGESVEKPDLYRSNNIGGSLVLFDEMDGAGVTRIVVSSSAATYGDSKVQPIVETQKAHPTNPYGETKLAVDNLLTDLCAEENFAAISLRYFNVAGALKQGGTWLAERHNPETHLIPNVLNATPGKPLKIFGTDWDTKDGTCIRDYIHVVDLADAHLRALDALVAGRHEIINLGSGGGYSVREVVNTASKIVGYEIPAIEVERRAGDPAILIASIEKAKEILQWEPTRDLEAMISDAHQSIKEALKGLN
jgi:UDP-glucose 4-epimerase